MRLGPTVTKYEPMENYKYIYTKLLYFFQTCFYHIVVLISMILQYLDCIVY
jgi:hypothetical protein